MTICRSMCPRLLLSLAGMATSFSLAFGCAQAGEAVNTQLAASGGKRPGIVVPQVDSARGQELFVDKGCVICHSVNGVGGKAAPALDASEDETYADPFEFMARMWRGAEQMILLQKMDFGYQLEFDGNELADLAAFAQDHTLQQSFSEDDIPDVLKDWIITEPYLDLEEWDPEAETDSAQ